MDEWSRKLADMEARVAELDEYSKEQYLRAERAEARVTLLEHQGMSCSEALTRAEARVRELELRLAEGNITPHGCALCESNRQYVDRMRARIEALEGALRQIAATTNGPAGEWCEKGCSADWCYHDVARAALAGGGEGGR